MQKVVNFKQSLDSYLRLIDTRILNNDLLGALDSARRALEYAKTRADRESLNIIIGQIYFEMELYELSCEHFFRAVRIPETRAAAFFGIGRNMVKMDNARLALDYFDAVLELSNAQDFAGAVLEWTNILKNEIESAPQTRPTLAVAKNLVKMKKFDDAITLLTPLTKNDIEAKIYLADVLIMASKFQPAREILFEILRDDPVNVSAILVLSTLCYAEHDNTSLEINLQKIDGIPLEFKHLVLVGSLYAGIGKYENAANYFERAVKADEYNTRVWLYLAIVKYNLGNIQDAQYCLNQARWIDIENPVLNAYHEIFTRKTVAPPLKLATSLPKSVAEAKRKNIIGALSGGHFCDEINHSLFLIDDIEWEFSTKSVDLTARLSSALSRCKKKKATVLYRKLLLSIRLNKEQKFNLTKYAIINENFKIIDVTGGYRYRSFRVKTPSPFLKDLRLKSGYAGAISYAEINDINVNFEKITQKIVKNLQNFVDLPENVLSCLYFCENAQVLKQACIYFGVGDEQVYKAINDLGIIA